MWDENKVLELLMDMPQVLTDENLCEIQKLIDDNKYWNSKELHMDLCGVYAPFCKVCDKTVLTPCAVAYVRMKVAEGMALSMETVSSEIADPEIFKEEKKEVSVPAKPVVEPEPIKENKKIVIGVGYRKF